MMQPAANTDFGLEVKFASQLLPSQTQGIIVQQDDNNWLRFDTFNSNGTLYVFAAATNAGVSQAQIQVLVNAGAASHLRVNRQGNVWKLEYSADGSNWKTAGSFTRQLNVTAVGTFAANHSQNSTASPFKSQVDYFVNTAAPLQEDAWRDELAPTASLLAPDLDPIQGSSQNHTFTISYSDNVAIAPSTLGNTDIRVIGPNGFNQLATLIRVNNDENGMPRNVTYGIAAPGGSWDANDSGEYTVFLETNAVTDTNGNFAQGGELGNFDLNISNPSSGITFPGNAGVVSVASYGAIPNDGIDDTAAIQQALNENASLNRIVYFANGVYDVSGQLKFAGSQRRTILQGESRDGTIIKLKNNSDLDKAVICTGDPFAQHFRNSIRDLTVDIGIGNPKAKGIDFIANNQGSISNVKIVSRDGQGAIGLDLSTNENGPLLVENVHIVGFDVGIQTWNPTASQTFEHIRLENQNQYGWKNFNQSVFVRDLQSINAVPVVWNMPDGTSDFTLVDSTLIGVGAASSMPAILNQKQMYVRNLTTSGYELAIRQDDKGRGNPSQSNGYVAEWIARGEFQSLFSSPPVSLNLPVTETPNVPWDNLSDWASPLAYGGIPNDGIDDTAAIQAAIDSGAKTVYLPNGTWNLNGSVELRGNVQRLLGTEAWVESTGAGLIKVSNGTAPVVAIERLDAGSISFMQDSSRTLVMSSLIIDDYENTSQGTGDLYIEDVSGGPWLFNNQNVWARQINPETGISPRIKNNGGNLWILGYKTEDEGTIVETVNGGKTELLGGYLLNGSFGTIPAFINNESSLSFTSVSYRSFSGGSVPIGVRETRNGVTKTTTELPAYYTGYRVSVSGDNTNNTLLGGNSNDTLIGVDPAASNPGRGEIDSLTGFGGADTLVLGDTTKAYYNDGLASEAGLNDYALITDFSLTQQDVIRLHGSASDYRLGSSPQGLPNGTGIFLKTSAQDELIAIIQGSTNLDLNSSAFSFV
jgi:regulation of enolase protein 1 (concanavalin A-like superfamily)